MLSKKAILPLLTSIFIFVLMSACTKSNKNLGFNTEEWKGDKLACNGVRSKTIEQFVQAEEQLMGLNQRELFETLGKPDKQELHSRGQKFFTYFLQPGGQCPGHNGKQGRAARIRLSALNIVNEISYDNF